MKIDKTTIEENSLVTNFLPADYVDVFGCVINTSKRIDPAKILFDMWNNQPKWVRFLFRLRDILVLPFGLKTGNKTLDTQKSFEDVIFNGKELSIMKIPVRNENEIVLQLIDKHLTAELSIYSNLIADDKLKIVCATLVHYHNKLGVFYFFVIKPFHKIIVKSMLNIYYGTTESNQTF